MQMMTNNGEINHDPAAVLYEEHDVILSALDLLPEAGRLIGVNDQAYVRNIRKLLGFFRDFADKIHHHKEEEILFVEMEKKNAFLGEGIISEMLTNHCDFRDSIAQAEEALVAKDHHMAQRLLEAYAEALRDHIAVENEELFQMVPALFSPEEARNIKYRFEDADREQDAGAKERLIRDLLEMQNYFKDLRASRIELK